MAAKGHAAGARTFDPLAPIRLQYPRWKIWRSSANRPWATRIGRYPANPPAGFAMTVDADTPRELRQVLADQEARSVGPD